MTKQEAISVIENKKKIYDLEKNIDEVLAICGFTRNRLHVFNLQDFKDMANALECDSKIKEKKSCGIVEELTFDFDGIEVFTLIDY